MIGQIGVDPGSEWIAAGVGTQDETIRRACGAVNDPVGTDAFDPSLEWTTYPQDDVSDFGQHNCP